MCVLIKSNRCLCVCMRIMSEVSELKKLVASENGDVDRCSMPTSAKAFLAKVTKNPAINE